MSRSVPYFDGPLEGLNHNVRTLQRSAYGDLDDFRLALHVLHATDWALIA